jgi:sensor histidine kinase regulating citrate/malate metabolism
MLTKKIVDDLRGIIEVETESGVGSTFSVRIPAGKKTWRRRFTNRTAPKPGGKR